MLKTRLPKLLNWFRHPITNALSEVFNCVIHTLKSNARGFRNFGNYRTRILFYCGKLDLKTPRQVSHEIVGRTRGEMTLREIEPLGKLHRSSGRRPHSRRVDGADEAACKIRDPILAIH